MHCSGQSIVLVVHVTSVLYVRFAGRCGWSWLGGNAWTTW